MYGRVKVPGVLKNWISVATDIEPGKKLFVPLYEVIRGNIHKLYDGMTISGMTLLRITRDAEVEMDDDSAAELRELVREQIRQGRYEPIVRLEFGPGADPMPGFPSRCTNRFDYSRLLLLAARCSGPN